MPQPQATDAPPPVSLSHTLDDGSFLPADRIVRRRQWQPRVEHLPVEPTMPAVGTLSRASGWLALGSMAAAAVWIIARCAVALLPGALGW